jgi:pimeloyl-ACP methyl ester carboxylesterase
VLRGVTSPTATAPAELLRGTRHELAALEEGHPGFLEAYSRLIRHLEAQPVAVRMGPEEVKVDGTTFQAAARFLLYDPRTAQSLPAVVTATAAGESGPVTQVMHGLERTVERFHIPVLLGVLCAEDIPFWDVEDTGSSLAAARLRANALAACRTWSVSPAGAAFRKAVVSKVPTLLLSGEHDPATPAASGDDIAETLPQSLHLVTPGIGHFPTWTGCYSDLVTAFFDGGSLETLDVACAQEAPSR